MNKKYLRKEDIKSGMLVEYCGELCLVVGSTSGLCLCGVDHWCPVEDVEMWRITRVYDRTHPRDARKLEIGDRQLVWEGKPDSWSYSRHTPIRNILIYASNWSRQTI